MDGTEEAMSEAGRERENAGPELLRTPVSLYFQAEEMAELAAATNRSADELAERRKVLGYLSDKILKLDQSESVLEALVEDTMDPNTYADIAEQLRETRGELSYCRARYTAINRGLPFRAPSRDDELALLAAIQRVSSALANTNALVALLGAIHGLVAAYAAGSTEG